MTRMFRLKDEAAYMEMMAERGARFQRGAQVVDTQSTSGGGVRDLSCAATPAGGDRTHAAARNDVQPPGPLTSTSRSAGAPTRKDGAGSPPVVSPAAALTFAHVVEPASKYHNVRTGGYASKREARRASVLRNREARGEITDLQEQVPFLLVPKAMDEAGKVIERAATYIADFVYRENGERVCEDCKGMRTDIYILKRKLMLMVHGIRIRET